MSYIECLLVMKVTATLWHVPELLEKREKIETLAHLPSYLTQTHMLLKQLKAIFSNLPGNNRFHEGL